MKNSAFQYKKPNFQKLAKFGFTQSGDTYFYAVEILDGQFELRVNISADEVKTELIDLACDEPYTLHLVEEASGAFVGAVRAEYERVLTEISEKCFEREVFKSEYAKRLIEYVREQYGDEPEYLWEKFPENAVWRRKDNKKWYGAILSTDGKKFGREGIAEILDLRMETEKLENIVDDKNYFRGWHMNKKHWFTVILDGSVPIEEIFRFLDESYLLSNK